MTSRGLKKKAQFEHVIGEGFSIIPIQRPFTDLSEDPCALAYASLGNDSQAVRELEWRLRAVRRFDEEVRWAAINRGVSVGQHMAGSGLGGAGTVPCGTLGDHDNDFAKPVVSGRGCERGSHRKVRSTNSRGAKDAQ